MKILVIPSWYPPKSGFFFQELNEAILHEKNTVDVLVNTVTSIKQLKISDFFHKNIYYNEAGLNVFRSNFYNIPKLNFISNRLWIKNTVKRYIEYSEKNGHPDIIHAHSSIWAGVAAYRIYKKFSIPYVITEHRSRFIFNTPEAEKMLPEKYFPLLQPALKNASHITCVSPALCPKLTDIEKSVETKTVVIPNTVDSDKFKPGKTKNSENEFKWFSLGKLNPVKGFDILLKAMSILINNTDKTVTLRIGGDGREYKNLRKLSENLNLTKNVVFLGNLDKNIVVKEMQKAHAFVLPSRFEAFGVVYIEAAACGLPLVGTDAGGQASIINEKNGYLAKPENPEILAETMLKMMRNYQSFDKKEIRNETIKKYDKQTIAKKYCNLFSKIINEQH